MCWKVFVVAVALCGYVAASNGWVWLVPPLASNIPSERHTLFLVDLWMHNASYLSGFLGGLVVIAKVWRGRRLGIASFVDSAIPRTGELVGQINNR